MGALFLALALLTGGSAPATRELVTPRSGEAFFGEIEAAAPAGARSGDLYVDGRFARRLDVRRGRVSWWLRRPPGRIASLSIRFGVRGASSAREVWLLPHSAERAAPRRSTDGALSRTLGELGHGFPGWAALWVQDLRTGRAAGWNSDALFDAASTVKLGVLLAALQRFGPRPERSEAAKDLRQLAWWSSDAATNRLLVRLGGGSESAGAHIAEEALRRAGAYSSTFPGGYRVEQVARRDAPSQPPVHWRRTTARDLARVLYTIHAAALGDKPALRRVRLSRHEARVGLAYLLSARTPGILRRWIDRSVPLAQKQGWTTATRHTAAVVYRAQGPLIVVVLTYRPGISDADAQLLGRRVAALTR